MRNNRKYWFVIFSLITLMLTPLVACGQPGYTTYTNKEKGYSIRYPLNWQVEVTEDSTICVIKSPSRFASVRIDVIDAMPAQQAAQRWILAMGTAWAEFAVLENKPMGDFWDWYISYDYEAETGIFHGEAYFKQTTAHVYKLDTAGDVAGYKNYPFSAIISSFKLNQ